MISNLNIIFWGTPEFSAIILEKLLQTGFCPSLIITAPDKPKGRDHILLASPVKNIALQHKIPYLQPEKIKENKKLENEIAAFGPDLFIVAAYGLIIPSQLLDLTKHGAINVHPSLLPKYRGPSPIQTALLNGDELTSVTLILMTEKMDAGPIIANQKFEISAYGGSTEGGKNQNYLELSDELANLGADLLIKNLPLWLEGKTEPVLQDETKATYTKIIKKEDGLIDFNKTAEEIERQTRAFYPWPGCFFKMPHKNKGDKILKILEAEVLSTGQNKKTGLISEREKEPVISCLKDSLILKKVQLEGKKVTGGKDFLNGYRELIGQVVKG